MAEVGYLQAIIGAGKGVWSAAIAEITVVAGISLIPLMGAAFHETLPIDSTVSLAAAFQKAFLSGQLLFYSLGFIATILWHSNKDFRHFFPVRVGFVLYGITGIVICSMIIGFDPDLSSTNKAILAPVSLCLFASSLVSYALMAVVVQVQVKFGENQAKEDAALEDAVRRSRGLK